MDTLNQYDIANVIRRIPKAVKEAIIAHGIPVTVAGGFVRAVVAGEEVSDIDLFAPTKDKANEAARKIHSLTKEGIVYTTDNAYTVFGGKTPIQVIHRWTYESPELLISSFDFTIAGAAVWYVPEIKRWNGICHPQFYSDLAAKRLVYTSPMREEEAGGSLLRACKFMRRGYHIPLDSLAQVMARVFTRVDTEKLDLKHLSGEDREKQVAHVVRGLLYEVDPNTIDLIENSVADPNLMPHTDPGTV